MNSKSFELQRIHSLGFGETKLKCEHVFEGRDQGTDELKWMGTAVDLVFGSNSQLRAIAEVYACDDSQQAFVRDFVAAWDKVMNLDRFEIDSSLRNGS